MFASIKNYLPVALIACLIGCMIGYSVADSRAEIQQLKTQQVALKAENQNLLKKLEVEYEHQKTAQITVAKTQEDLADLEGRYNDAITELNLLQLQSEYSSGNSSALPSDASSTSPVSQGKCECSGEDKAKFQRLLTEQMIVAKDCDINATYLNNLIEWYNQISNEYNKAP